MANISAIKLPNNTTYNIVDKTSGYTKNTGTITKVQTTAGAHTTINVSSGAATFNVPTKTSHLTNDSGFITNAGVTGVKGGAESSYRTGQVNLTPANLGAVAKNDELLTTNPFRPTSLSGPYISKIDNAFYAADKRWNVSMTNISGSVATLFDGSYESNVVISAGKTGVLTMDFTPSTYFPGYPYGYILISFYYTGIPVSVSGRVYCNYEAHGIGWHNISFSPISDSGSTTMVYRSEHQGYYNISQLEISIVGASNPTTKVTQVEIHLDRPDSARTPFLSKYAAETLYYDLTAPNFRGNLTGNVTGNVSGSAGSVAWSGITSKPTTISGYGITDAKIASGVITLGSNTITPLTSSSTLSAAKLSGAIPSAVTATTQSTVDDSTKIATTAFVHDLFDTVPGGTVTNIATGSGLTGGPIDTTGTISHADTSTQSSISASGRRYITAVTLDDFGHVTGLSTGTETVTNTDTKLKVAEVTSATQYYPLVGTGTTAAERQYDTTGFKYKGTTGTTSAIGSAILELGNSTASGTAGNKQAQLVMYGTNAKKATITLANPSADIALALPTSGGTLALASQIPSSTNSATTGITASTTATKTTLGTAGSVTGVQSTTTTASKVTLGTAFSIAGVSGSVSVRGVKTGNNSTTTASKVTVGSHSTDYGVKSAGSGSFTQGTFTGGSLVVTNHVLSFTPATHGADSHTHTAPTLGSKVPTVSASDITVPIRADADTTVPKAATAVSIPNVTGATDVTVPIKNTSATSIPNVSVASATVSITDPGHTHNI